MQGWHLTRRTTAFVVGLIALLSLFATLGVIVPFWIGIPLVALAAAVAWTLMPTSR